MKTSIYEKLKQDPIETLKSLSNKEIVSILEKADEQFFNTNQTLFDDDMYDIIKKYLRDIDKRNPYLSKVGAKITINKELLPYYMGSLDKIKEDEKEINRWKQKYTNDIVISEKLDGISCLLYYDGNEVKMLTRGNGTEGQNVSHILKYLKIDTSKFTTKIAIRGELIMSRHNWDETFGSNARNVVAGTIHSKVVNKDIIDKIDFVAYDMLYPRKSLKSSLETLSELKILTVKHKNIQRDELNVNLLSDLLQKWRKDSLYEIDGIVVHDNGVHNIISGRNPKYAFAFKTILTNEQAEVIVTDVEWNVSKHRNLKPLIKFNQVVLSGVKIKQATGFNGKYIKENKIGAGSRLIIIRSGDVIPHVLKVLSPSSTGEPKMPTVAYKWNGEYEISLFGDEKNKEQDISSFVYFMNTLSVKGVKEGVIKKLYESGYDTLSKIINIKLEELLKIDGFKQKSAESIYNELHNIRDVDCHKLMAASNVFGKGFGERKIKLITNEFPFIIKDKAKTLSLKLEDLLKIKGLAEISSQQFIDKLPDYMKFYEELNITCKTLSVENAEIETNAFFKNKTIVFSGFRNKEWEKEIEKSGGKITTSISKNTDYLVVKDKTDITSKIQKAQDLNVAILSWEEFMEKI
jgi:NAD-dependent DNA ligase